MGNDLARRVRENTDTSVEKRESGAPTLAQQIQNMEEHFRRAMPRGAEATQLVRDALTCLRTTPKLMECEPQSVLGALMTCAQLGLRPSVPGLGHAWPLPFWDSRYKWLDDKGRERTGGQRAQLIIGYQGFRELAQRSGQIATVIGRVVYENDLFEIDYGLADNLVHRPRLDGSRGAAVGYYAIVKYTAGGYAFWHMSKSEVEEHRDKYAMARKPIYVDGKKTGETEIVGPWRDNFDEMAVKGLALDTPIPTPTGWTTMERLGRGDQVFDMDGQRCRVTAVSEVKNLDCYRITFANGTSIVCDDEHRWVAGIGSNSSRDGWRVHEIKGLYAAKAAGKSVTMPVTKPLDTADAALELDPWVLGYWLGNGNRTAPTVTCHADDLADVVEGIRTAGYEIGAQRRDPRGNAVSVYIKGIKKTLAALGVLGYKHVPPTYLRASGRQRLALLRGLVDSDGSVDKRRGRVTFTNTNRDLADAVAELARSLGEIVHRRTYQATGYGKTVTAHTVSWLPSTVPATFGRKADRVRARSYSPYRGVKSIELVPSVPTQCIAVDSPSRTYLAGDDMVPTHNTVFLRLAKWMPKNTELASAIEADSTVRVDVTPDADAMLYGERPELTAGADEPDDQPADPAQPVDAEPAGARLHRELMETMPAPAETAQPASTGTPPTKTMMARLHASLADCGVSEVARHKTLSDILRRPIASASELTKDDAATVIDVLGRCTKTDDPSAALDYYLDNVDQTGGQS